MTVDVNSPALITSLASVLSRATAWFSIFPGGNDAAKQAAALAATYYPDAVPSAALPLAILELDARDAEITLVLDSSAYTVAQVQAIGDALTYQLQSRFRLDMTGVVIATEPTASEVLEATDWAKAGGNPAHAIKISATIGVTV